MAPLSYSELYRRAWNNMKDNLAFIAVLSFVFCTGVAAFNKIPVVGFIFTTLLTSSYFYTLLQIKNGKTIGYQDFFWGFLDLNRAIKLLIMSAVVTMIMVLAFILLVIPGVWFVVASSFATCIFVTKNPDPFDAIKASLKMVKGRWWYYFGLACLSGMVLFAGILCFVIGIFVSLPLISFVAIEATEHFYQTTHPASGELAPEPPPIA